MQLEPFRIEHYYGTYEFSARFMLSSSDAQTRSVGELLALEDGAAERLAELPLSYTQSSGAPELREAIRAAVRAPRARRRAGGVQRRGGDLPAVPRPARARRPRHRRDPLLRVRAAARAQHRRRRERVAPPPRGRLAPRRGRPRGARASEHPGAVREHAPQPDRPAHAARGVPRGARARPRREPGAVLRRGLPRARARPLRPPACRVRRARHRRVARLACRRPTACPACASGGSRRATASCCAACSS